MSGDHWRSTLARALDYSLYQYSLDCGFDILHKRICGGSRIAAKRETPSWPFATLDRRKNYRPTANRPQLRVCAKASRGDCKFTDLAAAAAAAVEAGAEIILAAGLYEQGAVLEKDRVVLRGEPGAHLKGHAVEGKAALVIRGSGVTIDGIECSDIQVPDGNGACIRIEADDLTVRNVYFHDNQDEILSGPGGGTVLVENSQFERNGYGGQAHGLYIGQNVREFVFRGNEVLSTKEEGHGVKSRAHTTVIENNVIAGLDGNDSRAIDLPNGGEVTIRGNLLEKGPKSANNQMIGLALEGPMHPTNRTIIRRESYYFRSSAVTTRQAIKQRCGCPTRAGNRGLKPITRRGRASEECHHRREGTRRARVRGR